MASDLAVTTRMCTCLGPRQPTNASSTTSAQRWRSDHLLRAPSRFRSPRSCSPSSTARTPPPALLVHRPAFGANSFSPLATLRTDLLYVNVKVTATATYMRCARRFRAGSRLAARLDAPPPWTNAPPSATLRPRRTENPNVRVSASGPDLAGPPTRTARRPIDPPPQPKRPSTCRAS